MPEQPDTPTIDDLRQIAKFLRERAYDEARGAGMMEFYTTNGATIQGRLPKVLNNTYPMSDDDRAKVAGWLGEHTPDRFMNVTSQLAHLADALADALADVPEMFQRHRSRLMWDRLAAAARLWQDHPDFLPAWADDEAGDG